MLEVIFVKDTVPYYSITPLNYHFSAGA